MVRQPARSSAIPEAISQGVPQAVPKPAHTARRVTLGRVPSLSEHLRPDWWQGLFNSIYLKTDGDVVCDQNLTRSEVDVIAERLHLSPEDRILDLCCGHGRHSLELARRGFRHVTGLDQSAFLISRARRDGRFEKLPVRFLHHDARELPFPPGSFDVAIVMGNSLGYSESMDEDEGILRGLARALRTGGRVLLDIADGEYLRNSFEPRSWEWIDDEMLVCRERELSGDGLRLISREIVCHANKGVIADQFYAERLYTRRDLIGLLHAAGFGECAMEEVSTASERNEDLGMMARRLMITAVLHPVTQIRTDGQTQRRKVAVLLGDPMKPNSLLPNELLSNTDTAFRQLRTALRALNDYEFRYFTKHDSLIDDLRRHAHEIDLVFNLCDEGFNNQAKHELHVPALLELLGIPYTGSGPQCLAQCYDKALVRAIARDYGIGTPETYVLEPGADAADLPFAYPVIAKPNFGDGSFGITQNCVAYNGEELAGAIDEIRRVFAYDRQILIEQFLPGAEVTLAIVGNPPGSFTMLPMLEDDYSGLPAHLPRIRGHEAKWLDVTPYEVVGCVPARIPDEARQTIERGSAIMAARLECRDYTRFDWRLDAQGVPKLLEVNPNPAWSWVDGGDIDIQIQLAGMSYGELLRQILEAASTRLALAGWGKGVACELAKTPAANA
jgi:D-alanine-D-alanine ligase